MDILDRLKVKSEFRQFAKALHSRLVAADVAVTPVAEDILGVYSETFWTWREERETDVSLANRVMVYLVNQALIEAEAEGALDSADEPKYKYDRRAHRADKFKTYWSQWLEDR